MKGQLSILKEIKSIKEHDIYENYEKLFEKEQDKSATIRELKQKLERIEKEKTKTEADLETYNKKVIGFENDYRYRDNLQQKLNKHYLDLKLKILNGDATKEVKDFMKLNVSNLA